MKRIFTLALLAAFTEGAYAQMEYTFDFERAFSDTVWNVFANGANGSDADIDIVMNPWNDYPNPSDSVLRFIVHEDCNLWVGAWTDSCGTIEMVDTAHTLVMMVFKPVISRVDLKIEVASSNGATFTEVFVENSYTDEWELLTFDFTDGIGKYYDRLVFFPDFPATVEERTWGEIEVYIDNIAVPTPQLLPVKDFEGVSMSLYPNPADFRMAVQCPGMTSITLYDILGKKIRTIRMDTPRDSKVIEVGDLSTGLYVVSAESATGKYTMPFVKK
jgi:hypothetical protein